MIEFLIAAFFLLISPGPGVLTTAGIGAAFGFRSGLGFLAGLCLGGFLVMLMVISGLAAFVFAVPVLRQALLLVSLAYLGYLAFRIATAGSKIGFGPAKTPLGFRNGLMLQFINPKAYVVATTVFSGFRFMPATPVQEVIVKLLVFNAIWIPVHLIWLGAGTKIGQLDLAPKSQQKINIGMAISLVIVVIAALLAR